MIKKDYTKDIIPADIKMFDEIISYIWLFITEEYNNFKKIVYKNCSKPHIWFLRNNLNGFSLQSDKEEKEINYLFCDLDREYTNVSIQYIKGKVLEIISILGYHIGRIHIERHIEIITFSVRKLDYYVCYIIHFSKDQSNSVYKQIAIKRYKNMTDNRERAIIYENGSVRLVMEKEDKFYI